MLTVCDLAMDLDSAAIVLDDQNILPLVASPCWSFLQWAKPDASNAILGSLFLPGQIGFRANRHCKNQVSHERLKRSHPDPVHIISFNKPNVDVRMEA